MKKLMLFMFVMIFLVGTISALEIDNVQSYDKNKKEYTITNAFGLGNDIAKIKLNSDLMQKVPIGYQKVAEFEVKNYNDYVNVFNDMEFYNIKDNNRKFIRDFDYKYKAIVQVPDYVTVCDEKKNVNGTMEKINCHSVVSGTRDGYEWKTLDKSVGLLKENLTIGIFTEVQQGDKVEWIPTLYGERLIEWAGWEEGWNADLLFYAKMNETSGDVQDFVGTNSLNVDGATLGAAGIINFSVSFDGTNDELKNASSQGLFYDLGHNWTIAHWVDFNSGRNILSWGNATCHLQSWIGASGAYSIRINNGACGGADIFSDTGVTPSGTFEHAIWVFDKTSVNISLYVNGTYQASFANDYASLLGNSFQMGEDSTGGFDFGGSIDEVGIWNRSLTPTEITNLFDAQKNGFGNGSFTDVFLPPAITLNSPVDNFTSINQTIDFNGSVIATTDVTNVTLFIDGILNETNSSGINNADYLFTKTIADGDHNWTYESCNDKGCTIATTRNFKIGFIENSQTFNSSSFETATETFTINITTNGTAPTNANLIYNGTLFSSATITNTAGDDYDIMRTIDIPLVSGTKTWFFNFTIGSTSFNSTTQSQIVNLTDFQHITSGLSYINISFKNETVAEESVTAEIDLDWTFWLGTGAVFKTLSFTNTTENEKYEFALLNGANRTLNANVTLTYDNSISEQRSFNRLYSLTNITTNQTLFLLPTADGIFVTFQTVNSAEQVISGVTSNVTKGGNLISLGITDDAGLIQYFLDPDTTYVFTFFKTGFALVTTTLKPTQSSFTIIMGGALKPAQNDTTKGISYIINPLANVLSNNTETEFNLTFSSTFWSLDIFGFALKNSTGDVFNITTSTTNTGGFLSRNLNTGDNTNIQIEIFWTIDGNQTNVTRTWIVIDKSDEGFSIKTFFDDLSIYLTSGIFGLTSFGLGIIIFMIIILTTGILSMKLAITNPAGLSIIVFAMVLFFDVGLGIIPNPIGAVPNFPSIFVGVVFLGLLLKEAIIR